MLIHILQKTAVYIRKANRFIATSSFLTSKF
uniref:Uncharacterized protein n=1 Tax=Rhizophora mucronata TaxID=61149 RepID=A0A2P2MZD3_RHIMU